MSQSPRPRRGRPGHDQAAVLRAAIEVFNRRGYDATTIGDIAATLGVTKSAIYHHVPSKEHLLDQALGQALDALEAALQGVTTADAAGPDQELRAALHVTVETLIAHLPAVTLLLHVRGNTPVEQAALQRRREIDQRLAAMVERAATSGAIRDDLDPLVTSRLLFGMVNSLTEWLRPDATDGHAVRRLADHVTALAFDGLRTQT